MTASKNNHKCIKPTCTYRDIISINGSCKSCNNYLVPDKDAKACVKPSCLTTLPTHMHLYLAKDGQCKHCPLHHEHDKNLKTCNRCDDYMIREAHHKECTKPSCPMEKRLIILKSG